MASMLNRDFKEFVELLHAHGVEYLLELRVGFDAADGEPFAAATRG